MYRVERIGPASLTGDWVWPREPVRGSLQALGINNNQRLVPLHWAHTQGRDDSLQCCNNIDNSTGSDHQRPPCQVGFLQDGSGCPIRERSTQSWTRSLAAARGAHYCAIIITTLQYEVLISVVH